MFYWLSLGSYTKIGLRRFGATYREQLNEADELSGLNSLDQQVITDIHSKYYLDVFRLARFRVSDEGMAEDIAGDVFMRLLEAVHKGRGPVKNLRGWLLRTASNMINDYYRRLYKNPAEEPEESIDQQRDLYLTGNDPVDITERVEKELLLSRALQQLSDSQKLVISLRFGNLCSLEETARIMGKNTNTIKALQFRALISLRKQLKDTD